MNTNTVLMHHGVKGQKWGVRRYQYADGSLTPAGRKRYNSDNSAGFSKIKLDMTMTVDHLTKTAKTRITGKQYVDGVLKDGTTFSRIQTASNFEEFAFYATYKKKDSNKYMGLFGKNLVDRARADAKKAEKIANSTGNKADVKLAKELRDRADNIKVYQLKIDATRKLKIPSDDNASDIVNKLLKENKFKDNLVASIADSKEKMRRPSQQILFKQAQNALQKDPSKMSKSEKIAIYKAFNLSLVNHNKQEIAAQNRFYDELKKKGYNALLDYNDKQYSSYHAKRPMIVFDTESVRLKAVVETNPKVVSKLHMKYNAERIVKEIPANAFGLVAQLGGKSVSECRSYVDNRVNQYLAS